MRLILAIAVVAFHGVPVAWGESGNAAFWQSPISVPFRLVLPMFFALSGFLVMGSFERTRTLAMFFGLRLIRIFPALVVEVLLSAFLLGTIFTTLPLGDYFTDPLFFRYFLNMLGEPQYLLPGVFADNPLPDTVNGQLWTVPFELGCYLVLGLVGAVGLRNRPLLAPLAAIVVTLAYLAWRQYAGLPLVPGTDRPVSGPLLIIAFLVGASLYLYRERIPLGPIGGWGAGLASLILLANAHGSVIAIWPIAYFTVWLGTRNPRRLGFIKGADYSYGIFLYGFPIQQMLAATGSWSHHPLVNALTATALAWLFASQSWKFVERPALELRHPMKDWENRWLARSGNLA